MIILSRQAQKIFLTDLTPTPFPTMSLIENYGSQRLFNSQWPNHEDPHRCGQAPFVPSVDGPVQHSCGSYPDHFDKNGCNKYKPNYPDDLYIQTHGCAGLADCKGGVPPQGDVAYEGARVVHASPDRFPSANWERAWGHLPPGKVGPACKEGFAGGSNDFIGKLLWGAVIWVVLKWALKKKK